jgi:AcrR family transcriptional regulator
MGSEKVKQKILLSTIQCIEKYGLQNVTTRRITEMSGVNVAAINYHFGSKNNLIKAVLKTTLDEGFVNNIDDLKETWNTNTREALESFLRATMQGMMNFPNLTKAHFQESFLNNQNDNYSVKRLNEFLITFHSLISKLLQSRSERHKKIDIIQIWSALMLPGIMPGLFQQYLGSDLNNEADQADYIRSLIGHYIEN